MVRGRRGRLQTWFLKIISKNEFDRTVLFLEIIIKFPSLGFDAHIIQVKKRVNCLVQISSNFLVKVRGVIFLNIIMDT